MTSRLDLDAIAALFDAAGVCREPNNHVASLTPEAWARRCVLLGQDPRVVIRRLRGKRAEEERHEP